MYHIKQGLYLVGLYWCSVCGASSYDDFFTAIVRDDPGAIVAVLKRGFDVNTVNPAGDHGLILAIRQRSRKVTAALLEQPKVMVETRNGHDESPLMLAALQGETALCRLLMAKGADVNKPGWTALHYAATNGHLEVMTLLLDSHAYIDAASPNGTTPLMMAAHYGSAAAARLLLEAGADPLLKNEQGLSAIDFARRAERQEVADLISATVRERQPKGTW